MNIWWAGLYFKQYFYNIVLRYTYPAFPTTHSDEYTTVYKTFSFKIRVCYLFTNMASSPLYIIRRQTCTLSRVYQKSILSIIDTRILTCRHEIYIQVALILIFHFKTNTYNFTFSAIARHLGTFVHTNETSFFILQ